MVFERLGDYIWAKKGETSTEDYFAGKGDESVRKIVRGMDDHDRNVIVDELVRTGTLIPAR